MAALFKYGFVLNNCSNGNPPSISDLPDPPGILSKLIPSNAIEAVNTAVLNVLENEAPSSKRGKFLSAVGMGTSRGSLVSLSIMV